MPQLHVLFEHAAGYALFSVAEFEEVGMFLPQLEASVLDPSRFNALVKITAFSPFKSAMAALENMNAVSEGVLPDELRVFLEASYSGAGEDGVLGVGDPKLGAAITEALQLKCTHTGVVPEVIRGIRAHFARLVRGLTDKASATAQLGLGHSYSRAKVKFNVHRVDNMIIQSVALLDQLDKDVNTFSMRIREWYSYHFPELARIVSDGGMYAKLARLIGDRKGLDETKLDGMEAIVCDAGIAQAILDASRSSMGMDISAVDLLNIELFAARVTALAEYRSNLASYLRARMGDVAPNLRELVGEQVGARLIAHAGSLTSLAKYPASTVQILGAEKALFRALKTRGNTPKYGLLYHSTFIGRAGAKNKGRVSRYLANKCSIASRIDCFAERPTPVFGKLLRAQVEDRLKFYETGDVPAKNEEVMKQAIEENQLLLNEQDAGKKKKKRKSQNGVLNDSEMIVETESPEKKKKKKRKSENGEQLNGLNESVVETPEPKKKKKKNKNKEMTE